MNYEYRDNNYKTVPDDEIVSVQQDAYPYESTITALIQIDKIESPMIKLEHIYKCCTTELKKGLDRFW